MLRLSAHCLLVAPSRSGASQSDGYEGVHQVDNQTTLATTTLLQSRQPPSIH